jgi:peptidoglycan/LPS O-acetylase OafA/YrhL
METHHRKWNHAAWIGPLVALVGFFSYFTLAVRFPDLRDSAIVNLVLVLLGVAIAAWGVLRRRNWKSWVGFGAASAVALFFGAYIFAFTNQLPPPDTAPAVGAAAPPLELPDLTGRTMSLDSLRGERVVVVFYRGYW